MAFTNSAVTLIGTVSRDPQMKYLPNGTPVAEFGLVYNKRRKNQETNQWEDGDAQFYDIKCWRGLAENVAESIQKGNRVIVFGELEFRSWQADDGSKRNKIEVVAEAVGPDLLWATAQVQKVERSGQSNATSQPNQAPLQGGAGATPFG